MNNPSRNDMPNAWRYPSSCCGFCPQRKFIFFLLKYDCMRKGMYKFMRWTPQEVNAVSALCREGFAISWADPNLEQELHRKDTDVVKMDRQE
jgi:hypothetical protein